MPQPAFSGAARVPMPIFYRAFLKHIPGPQFRVLDAHHLQHTIAMHLCQSAPSSSSARCVHITIADVHMHANAQARVGHLTTERLQLSV